MTEIEYELRETDLAAFNDHQLTQTEAIQRLMRRYQVTVPGVLALTAFFLIFYYREAASAAFVGIIAILWAFFAPAFFRWRMRVRMLSLYSAEDKSRLLGKYTLRIEPRALVEITPSGESRISWSEVLRVEATKKYAFIFVDHQTALIVPRKTVRKGNLHEFVREADRHIEAAG
jgi:small-conductance mechanosensitive channel